MNTEKLCRTCGKPSTARTSYCRRCGMRRSNARRVGTTQAVDYSVRDGSMGRRRSVSISTKQFRWLDGHPDATRPLALQGLPLDDAAPVERPACRAECRDGPRPCPFVSCKYNLYIDVNPDSGSVVLNFPDKELWELADTCALDVADRGGVTLEEVGELTNLTRERIRQMETRAAATMRSRMGDCA